MNPIAIGSPSATLALLLRYLCTILALPLPSLYKDPTRSHQHIVTATQSSTAQLTTTKNRIPLAYRNIFTYFCPLILYYA